LASTMGRSETTQKVQRMPFSRILEAIAKGVEARLVRIVVAEIVTLETIHIARKLDIPEEEIQEWRSSRCHKVELSEASPFLQSVREMKKNFHELLGVGGRNSRKDLLRDK
jgi:hypothetical protein